MPIVTAMFVFSSLCTAALWFVVRAGYDLVWPRHRHDAAHARRRFWSVTLVAASIASCAAGIIFTSLFSAFAGWYAAVVVAGTYVGLCVALRALVGAFREQPHAPR